MADDFRSTEYMYGKLNKAIELQQYTGESSSTSQVVIDESTNSITVNVLRVPNKLTFEESNSTVYYDGYNPITINLAKYALDANSLSKVTLDNNILNFYDKNDNLITTVDFNTFIQEQANLAEEDSSSDSYVQNKSTKYLNNEGEDGSSPYSTVAQLNEVNSGLQESVNNLQEDLNEEVERAKSVESTLVTLDTEQSISSTKTFQDTITLEAGGYVNTVPDNDNAIVNVKYLEENGGKIDTISIGGEILPIDDNKNVNIASIDGSLIDDRTVSASKLDESLLESTGGASYEWVSTTDDWKGWELKTDYYRATNGTWGASPKYYSYYRQMDADTELKWYCSYKSSGQYMQIVVENPEGTFVKRWRTSDNNIPQTEEDAITINAGDWIYVSIYNYTAWTYYCNLVIYTKEITNSVVLANDLDLNTHQIDQVLDEIKKCNLQYTTSGFTHAKATEGLKIYIPTSTGYACQDFAHFVNDSIKCDNWLLDETNLYNDDFSLLGNVTSSGAEWEMAVHLKGAVDFIGGHAHGDEVMQSVAFFIDGKQVEDISTYTDRIKFNELRIIESSIGYNPDDEDEEALTHFKEYIFNKEGIALNQRVVWSNAYDMASGSYLAMCPPKKTSTINGEEVTITDSWYSDVNCALQEYDNSTNGHSYTSSKAFSVWEQSSTFGFSINMSISNYQGKSTGGYALMTDNSSSAYNKFYFVVMQTGTVEKNEVWAQTTNWKFEYNS